MGKFSYCYCEIDQTQRPKAIPVVMALEGSYATQERFEDSKAFISATASQQDNTSMKSLRFPLKPHFNPYLTNGFSHHYHLVESTFIFRGVRSDFYFLFNFSMKFLCANRIAPDGTPRSAASHLGIFCLPMSHKRDARLK